MTKEQIHDQKIAPLMEQIIAICREHEIPLIASFSLDSDLVCTTGLLDKNWNVPEAFNRMLDILYRPEK